MSNSEVVSTTASIPPELEQYKDAVAVGLYQLVKGMRPEPDELADRKKARINLSALARSWLEELLAAGEYSTQADAIRDALLVVKQGPAWWAKAKL